MGKTRKFDHIFHWLCNAVYKQNTIEKWTKSSSSFFSWYIRGAFNRFPHFLVQAFKIVVDSSVSNEHLQQELEYTLLKPDCHSWWISKMQSEREDTLEERYAIKFCFEFGKNATEMYRMLQTASGASCMKRASVFEWHKRFKEDRESVRDDEKCGRSKEVNKPKLIGQRVRVLGEFSKRFRRKRPALFKSAH